MPRTPPTKPDGGDDRTIPGRPLDALVAAGRRANGPRALDEALGFTPLDPAEAGAPSAPVARAGSPVAPRSDLRRATEPGFGPVRAGGTVHEHHAPVPSAPPTSLAEPKVIVSSELIPKVLVSSELFRASELPRELASPPDSRPQVRAPGLAKAEAGPPTPERTSPARVTRPVPIGAAPPAAAAPGASPPARTLVPRVVAPTAPRDAPGSGSRPLIRPTARTRDPQAPTRSEPERLAERLAERLIDQPIVQRGAVAASSVGRAQPRDLAPQPPREPPELPRAAARAQAMRGVAPPAERPKTVPPPLPPAPAPEPLEGDAQAPVFESTLRGLSRQQLARLASADVHEVRAPAIAPAAASGSSAPPMSWETSGASAPPMSWQTSSSEEPSARLVPNALAEPPALGELPSDPSPPVTATAIRPGISRFFPSVSVIALILLFQAFALPTAAGPPWELLTRPSEVTLQAFAAFLLVGVVHLLRVDPTTRGRVATALGLVLAPFAIVAAHAAVAGGAFESQPALGALWGGDEPWPAAATLAALVLIPAGLFARVRAPVGWGWGLFGAGLAALFATAFLLPLGELLPAMSDAPFLGDRVAAWAIVPLLVLLVASPVAMAFRPLARGTTALGFGIWGAALLPLVVLALFSARSDQWMQVLEPLKLASFLGAVAIYTSAALATVLPRRRVRRRT